MDLKAGRANFSKTFKQNLSVRFKLDMIDEINIKLAWLIMTKDGFDDVLQKILGEKFKKLEYMFSDSCFFLNRSNSFRNVVSFDFNGDDSFRVFIGIDYPYDQLFDVDSPPEGARLCKYYTGGSLSAIPRDIAFRNEKHLIENLERFKAYFDREIKNGFFGSVKTAEDYADSLPEVECIVKYEIYKRESIFDKASQEAEAILESYKNMLDIPKIKTFIEDDVKVFLSNKAPKNIVR